MPTSSQLPSSRYPLVLFIGLALLVASLSACSRDPAQFRFDDYRTRLARSLKLESAVVPEPAEPARRPRKRELVLDQSDAHISMLDFLRLNRCAIGEVIGQRNSVLGKVAPPSQRLFSDLEFLRLAPDCVATLHEREDDKLAETLVDAIRVKQEGLAIAIANATLASDEFSALWHVPSALGNFPDQDINALTDELRYVEAEVGRWLSGNYTHDAARFEQALGKLRLGDAGSLLAAAALTHAQLESANNLAWSRREGRPLCYNEKPSNQGRIVRRVIDLFFIGEIQLWLSRVNALSQDLMVPYRSLEILLGSAQSPAYRQWRRQRDSQLAWLSSAPRLHVKTIRPILASCGLAPGA